MNIAASQQHSTYQLVAPQQVKAGLENLLLLDVRTPAEFEDAHVIGAVLHPLGSLDAQQVKNLAATKSGCLIICGSGTRARQAAEKLQAQGVASLFVLEGGVKAWEACGLPLQRGKKMMSLERQVRIVAGAFVFTASMLGYFVNPSWIILSGFVGAGLVFAGVTDTCAMGMLLARMPWNNRKNCAPSSCCS